MKAPGMREPPIYGLPAEIVDLIVLHLDGQVDMKNLMLASSFFGRSVTEQLYHAPRIQASSLPLALRSARSSVGWQNARSLTIFGQLRGNGGCDLPISALVSVMKQGLVKGMYVELVVRVKSRLKANTRLENCTANVPGTMWSSVWKCRSKSNGSNWHRSLPRKEAAVNFMCRNLPVCGLLLVPRPHASKKASYSAGESLQRHLTWWN